MSPLLLPDPELRRVARHGSRSLPAECCGVLLGLAAGDGTVAVRRALATPNGAAGDRRAGFRIPPRALARARYAGALKGWEIVGFYHSHPEGSPCPSRQDLAAAWPRVSYLIVGMERGAVAGFRSWRLDAAGERFIEEHFAAREAVRPAATTPVEASR